MPDAVAHPFVPCPAGRPWPLLLALLLPLLACGASPGPPTEAQVKAAFILNFLKFVEWPAGTTPTNSPLTVLIPSHLPLGDELEDLLDGHTASDRRIQVRRGVEPLHRLPPCHVLLLVGAPARAQTETPSAFADRPVLTIGDAPGFAEAGGIIGFTGVQQKLRFEVNLDAAQRARLRLRSQLLNLARRVIREPTTPPTPPPP